MDIQEINLINNEVLDLKSERVGSLTLDQFATGFPDRAKHQRSIVARVPFAAFLAAVKELGDLGNGENSFTELC